MRNTFYITANIWIAAMVILLSNSSQDLATGIIGCLIAACINFYFFTKLEQAK